MEQSGGTRLSGPHAGVWSDSIQSDRWIYHWVPVSLLLVLHACAGEGHLGKSTSVDTPSFHPKSGLALRHDDIATTPYYGIRSSSRSRCRLPRFSCVLPMFINGHHLPLPTFEPLSLIPLYVSESWSDLNEVQYCCIYMSNLMSRNQRVELYQKALCCVANVSS